MNQQAVEELLAEHICHWLPPREAREIAAHLAALAGCRREVLALLHSEAYLRACTEFVRPSVIENPGALLCCFSPVELADRVRVLRERAVKT
eukprot:3187909-Alexandrium_andersonii.AAC.1